MTSLEGFGTGTPGSVFAVSVPEMQIFIDRESP
jgi:hypothetical protein